MKIKVSDLICKFFEYHGVKTTYLLSGGMMMHLVDSISKSSIRYICNHHEQASAMAAEGYARSTDSLGLCFATSGPGATNILTGVAGSWLDSVPVFFIIGQSRLSLTRRGLGMMEKRLIGNFEIDGIELSKSITKYAVFIEKPESTLEHLKKAYTCSVSGRPGPVLLEIPLDIQGATIELDQLDFRLEIPENPILTGENLSQLNSALQDSKRPLILVGHGVRVANQVDQFRKLITGTGIPVATTAFGLDVMDYDHPNFVGHVGLRGDRAGNFAVQACDLLITIGVSLHVTTTGYDLDMFSPLSRKIIINLDEADLKFPELKNTTLMQADIKSIVDILPNLTRQNWSSWSLKCQEWKSQYQVINEPHAASRENMDTYSLVHHLSELIADDTRIITDAGSLYYIIGQCFRVKKDQRVIVSGAFGSMGYALPTSIGAATAKPEHPVICITGDGSMQTNIQELSTVATYKPNLKIIVINNNGYASIRNTQANFMDGHLAASSDVTGVVMPNWKKICDAYGVRHRLVTSLDDFKSILSEECSVTEPVFIEAVMSTTVTMIPAVTSIKLPDGKFRSSNLHEMSPEIKKDEIQDLGIKLH